MGRIVTGIKENERKRVEILATTATCLILQATRRRNLLSVL